LSTKSPWPELTLLHETGHWIDQQAFGGPAGFGTATGAWKKMASLLENGQTAKAMKRMLRTGKTPGQTSVDLWPWQLETIRRDLKPEEMFARSYAQWIALESAHPRLLLLMQRADDHRPAGYGLTPKDAAVFSKLFTSEIKQKGWL
jgi:hypothetical protein